MVMETIKFESEHFGILRLDDHLENIAESFGEQSREIQLCQKELLKKLETRPELLRNITVAQYNFSHPELEAFYKKHGLFEKTQLHNVEAMKFLFNSIFVYLNKFQEDMLKSGQESAIVDFLNEKNRMKQFVDHYKIFLESTDKIAYDSLRSSIQNFKEDFERLLDREALQEAIRNRLNERAGRLLDNSSNKTVLASIPQEDDFEKDPNLQGVQSLLFKLPKVVLEPNWDAEDTTPACDTAAKRHEPRANK